jgi:hypothetical protein
MTIPQRTTHILPDGRLIRLVDTRTPSATYAGCKFCVAHQQGEDPNMCAALPECGGPRAWMDDTAWARFVSEAVLK